MCVSVCLSLYMCLCVEGTDRQTDRQTDLEMVQKHHKSDLSLSEANKATNPSPRNFCLDFRPCRAGVTGVTSQGHLESLALISNPAIHS